MSENLNEFTLQQEDNFKLKEIFFKVIRAWKLLGFLLAVFLSWAYFQVRYSIPIYESVMSILIKNDVKSNSGLTETSAFEDIEVFQVGNSMENEKAVLVSRTIIGQVVDSLDLQKAYFSVAGIADLTRRELYKSSPVRLLVDSSAVEINFSLRILLISTDKFALLNKDNTILKKIKFGASLLIF